MDKIKEENKNLIALRNNYFAMLFLLSGGVSGLFLAGLTSLNQNILFIFGLYLIGIALKNIRKTQAKITKNIERLK